MRRWIVVLLALVVVVPLAGCGIPGRGDTGASRPATVTPAAVPTDSVTATPALEIVPGVTPDGAVDAVVLAEAHRDALVGDSFTRRTTRTISEDGTVLRRTTQTYRVAPFRPRYRYRQTQTLNGSYPAQASVGRVDVWSNGTDVVARLEDADEVRYRRVPADEFSSLVVGITGHERVSALSGAFAFEVREQPNGNIRLVSETLRTPNALDEPVLTTGVRNATLSLDLSRTGLLRSYRLAYDVNLDDRTLRVVETMRLTDVGTTRVDRPSWYRVAVGAGGANATRTASLPEER